MKEGLTIGQLSEINAELHTEIAALKKQRDALAAENAELKRANSVALNILNDEETMITSLWASSVHQVVAETIATDAAIANIQAKHLEKFGDELLSDLRGDCWDEHDIKYIEMQIEHHLGELRKDTTHD